MGATEDEGEGEDEGAAVAVAGGEGRADGGSVTGAEGGGDGAATGEVALVEAEGGLGGGVPVAAVAGPVLSAPAQRMSARAGNQRERNTLSL
ncbi:hypothetical protein OG883_26085 [Streptomyces sp. NBC_01142]|uniref:hypothetical protein n=1 Tax=Streptomyces sp. NBC_01142 TaxID=2975865 RepID=UPI00224E2431|nr:hypothetical protein [Streptomyces sp. NBC_01142]MCX4823293.1 hypothetical protein [Streptomyces sp. NBC_01142]